MADIASNTPRGIGAAIVKRLASDGAAVAFTYASAQQKAKELVKEVEAAGGRALALLADSGDVDAVKGAVAETIKAFGGINILVNNAGVYWVKTYDQFTIEEFDQTVAINVRAIFAAVQANCNIPYSPTYWRCILQLVKVMTY